MIIPFFYVIKATTSATAAFPTLGKFNFFSYCGLFDKSECNFIISGFIS